MLAFLRDYGSYGPSTPNVASDEVLAAILAVYMGFIMVMLAFALVAYILQSLGMYTIAQRRGIRNPWLAWVPVGNLWIMGSISDQYQYVVKGKRTNRRKILLGMSLGSVGTIILMFVVILVAAINMALSRSEAEAATVAGLMIIGFMLMYFAMITLLITQMVFQYISLYDLYASCNPGNATLFLILSIFVSVTMPFFVFACRNKDEGMPPRVQEQSVVEPTYTPIPEQQVFDSQTQQ